MTTSQAQHEARALIPRACEVAQANGGFDMAAWNEEQMIAFLAAIADEYVKFRLSGAPF
jgi:hypothetical protein